MSRRGRGSDEATSSGNSALTTTTVVSSSTPNVLGEKLRGIENWADWKMLMEVLLGADDLWDVVETEQDQEQLADKKGEVYKRDQKARMKILFSLEPAVLRFIRGATTAYQVWSRLAHAFEDKGVYRRAALLRQLFSMRQTSTLTAYVLEFKDMINKIAETGKPVEDEVAAVLLLDHVKPEIKGLCQILERTSLTKLEDGTTTLEFDIVSEELLREGTKTEQGESKDAGEISNSAPVALRAESSSHSSHRQHGGGGQARGGGGWRRKKQLQAQKQTTPGQQTTNQQPQQKRKGKFPPCQFCNFTNHPEQWCFWRNKQGKRKNNGDNDDTQNSKKPRLQDSDNNSGSNGPKNKWVIKMAKPKVPEVSVGVGAYNNASVNKFLEFYIDSGAFKNMCNDNTSLHAYRTVPRQLIECAGNEILYTEGIGTLALDHEKSNGLTQIADMTYVPNLSSNLLSVSSISKSGFATLFVDNYVGIYNKNDILINNKPLLTANESNGTYKVTLAVRQSVALKTILSDMDVWHKRLAHLGTNNLELLKHGLVDGFTGNNGKLSETCETCLKSRQVRASFPKNGALRATDLLELIHSDVCEITDSPSWSNHKYFVTFIDDKSRFTFVSLLQTKDQVFEKFKDYKTLVEKQLGKQIKILRSDNGGEYCNKAFDEFLTSHGILRQLSVAHTPEQNGVAERANRTLMEKVRAMLDEAGLNIRYWGEALMTAVYLKNISPTKAVEGMVPYQAWTGEKPNLENLRIFGCCAYVHVPKRDSKKLGNRGRKCIFVGYDEESKGYKLVDINQPRKVFVERSVEFLEHIYPALEISKPQKTEGEKRDTNPVDQQTVIQTTLMRSQRDSESSFWEQNDRQSDDQASQNNNTTSSNAENSNRTDSVSLNLQKRVRVPKRFDDYVCYGVKAKTTHDSLNACYRATLTDTLTPDTIAEALESNESEYWIAAIQDELKSFEENNVWSLEPLPEGTKAVGNRWVFKTKLNTDGSVLYKARLVAKGFTQTYGVDYFETFAPVVRRTTLRILFSTAVNYDLMIDHLDVKTAFLNGDLDETVYMSQPEGFVVEGKEHMVCKLNKAVYGLKQAARSWNLKANKILKDQGFKNFADEQCVYIKSNKSSVIIIALYVDDFYLIYNNKEQKLELLKLLNTHFKVKDLGEAKDCLGVRLQRNWKDGTLILHQEDYIKNVLVKFHMQDCKPVTTPMEFNLKLRDLKPGEKKNVPYQELIGCLIYLSVNTRPDISYAVSFLSQYNSNYTTTHWQLAKRLLQYLKLTSKRGLEYTKSSNPTFCLVGFADADWAGNSSDYKSYSGFCFTLDGNLVSWESKKQKLVAQSSTESEYISLTEAVKESLYLNELICNLFNCGLQTVTIFHDNMSSIKLSESENFSARTKHMGVRKQLVRDCVQDGSVCVEYLSTDSMPADILTKSLGRINHEKCCEFLKMSSFKNVGQF